MSVMDCFVYIEALISFYFQTLTNLIIWQIASVTFQEPDREEVWQ